MLKHAVLSRILAYLSRKESPFRFIDTHAGAGRYDLASAEAKRSPEWRDGIGRVLTARPPAPVAELLRPYLQTVGAVRLRGPAALLSGLAGDRAGPHAPAGPHRALRSEPERTRGADRRARARDGRLSIAGTDGYVALNAYLPPKERRGLVLIDPPFEAPDEAGAVVRALERALRKWPSGTYVAWRPIREAQADSRFLNSVAALATPNILRLELDVGSGPTGAHGQEPLARAGLLIVNPPHTLADEARTLMPWLAETLGRGGRGRHLCAWLTEPN